MAVFFNAVRKIGSVAMSRKLPNPTNRGADNPSQLVNASQNPCTAGQNTQIASMTNGTRTNARINGDTRRGPERLVRRDALPPVRCADRPGAVSVNVEVTP